jgi:tetratricopeptide (TPR) repeat protein
MICGLCVISLAAFLGGCVRPTQDELRSDGIHEYQVGHHERAMDMFQRVLHNDPSDAVSLFYMGRIYHTQKQYVKAYYYYQAAIDADPGFGYAESTKKYIKEVREQLGDLAAPLTTTPKQTEHPVP